LILRNWCAADRQPFAHNADAQVMEFMPAMFDNVGMSRLWAIQRLRHFRGWLPNRNHTSFLLDLTNTEA
jgi:hypothetical protein